MVPLHTLGVDIRGQYLGPWNFGYDLVVGNGIASTDILDDTFNKSIMAGIHFQPVDRTRIGISYYNDYMAKNISGAHIGHTTWVSGYTGPVNFELWSASIKKFTNKWEFQTEGGFNINSTDSLGQSKNKFIFTYCGYKIDSDNIIYVLEDFWQVSNKDLYTAHGKQLKLGVGYRRDINAKCNVKLQLERLDIGDPHMNSWVDKQYNIKIQLAYGL